MDESKTGEVISKILQGQDEMLYQLSGLKQDIETLQSSLKQIGVSLDKQFNILLGLQEIQKQKSTEILNRLYRIEAKVDMLK